MWVPDQHEGFVAGYVVKEEGDLSTVALSSTGEVRLTSTPASRRADPPRQLVTVSSLDLKPVNPPNYDGAEDIANLTHLNEASVVHNLKTRYHEDSIYVSRPKTHHGWTGAHVACRSRPADLFRPVSRRSQPIQGSPHLFRCRCRR